MWCHQRSEKRSGGTEIVGKAGDVLVVRGWGCEDIVLVMVSHAEKNCQSIHTVSMGWSTLCRDCSGKGLCRVVHCIMFFALYIQPRIGLAPAPAARSLLPIVGAARCSCVHQVQTMVVPVRVEFTRLPFIKKGSIVKHNVHTNL